LRVRDDIARVKSNPLNPPYQGEVQSPLIRGIEGVKYFLPGTTHVIFKLERGNLKNV
jgi:hypothetical protein